MADLSDDQKKRQKLFEFLEHSSASADMARDILRNKGWDVQSALEDAREMGLGKRNGGGAIVCVDVDSPRHSNDYSMGDSGDDEFSSLGSSTISSSPASSSTNDLAFTSSIGTAKIT